MTSVSWRRPDDERLVRGGLRPIACHTYNMYIDMFVYYYLCYFIVIVICVYSIVIYYYDIVYCYFCLF